MKLQQRLCEDCLKTDEICSNGYGEFDKDVFLFKVIEYSNTRVKSGENDP